MKALTQLMTIVSVKMLAIVLVLGLGFTSCKKTIVSPKENGGGTVSKVTSTKDLKVNENFDWSTTRNLAYSITPKTNGLLLVQGPKAELYYKAYLTAGTAHEVTVTCAAYEPKLYVFFNGVKEEVTLGGPVTNYTSTLK